MANDYFDTGDYTALTRLTLARAENVNTILAAVEAGFDLLPGKDPLREDRVTYGTDSGAADAYVVTMTETLTAYTEGLHVVFKAGAANTGASTINVDSLGVKSIKRPNGDALEAGDIIANGIIDLRYDGTNFLISAAAISGAALAGSQPASAALSTIAGLAVTDGNFIVGNGTTWVVESGATARTSLGLGTADSPQFTGVNVGHATDTTITRVSAGVIAVEGDTVLMATADIGVTVQAYSANLDTYAANALTAAEIGQLQNIGAATISATQWGYLGAMDQGVATSDTVQLAAINLGHATDTTLARVSAGVISVEGDTVLMATADIGVTVQGYDADTLFADTADVLTAGFAATPYNAGTKSSGTYTPDESNGNLQYAVNGGAHTLAPPTNNCTIIVQYTNNASAGAITTSGFTVVDGDSFTTTDGDDFLAFITKNNSFSHLHVVALQ